jgi:demethylmacrocin O-methyltransferase
MTTYNTDKFNSGLILEYLKMFSSLQDKEIKFLEVGYLDGEFLRWFRDNFIRADLYGIDQHPLISLKDNDDLRIKLFQIDQNDSNKLKGFGENFGKFDIIIDDASHREKETRNTFNCLWKYVKSGGWYIIEDWGAHYRNSNYGDMGKVVSEILQNKNSLGISLINITEGTGRASTACYKKK